MTENVKLKALDSFHSGPTGMVHARAVFETHKAHADDLIKRGVAVEVETKKAAEPEAKKAPEPQNKKAAEPENKGKK